MKKIRIDSLKPGMIFSQPVYVDGKNLLVPKGIPLRQRDIEQLTTWKILEVQTDGDVVGMVEESGPDTPSTGTRTAEPAGEADSASLVDSNSGIVPVRYRSLSLEVARLFERIKKNDDQNPFVIDRIVDSILTLVREQREEMILYILSGEQTGNNLAESAVNTSLLSVLLGMNMKLASHRLIQLATGALLHDLGMLFVPDSILEKKGNLQDEERRQIQFHPVNSHRLITKDLKYPDEIGYIGLQHHERWDGAGYPAGLKDEKIHLHARIVAVVDTFVAMVRNRPYRSSLIGYTAVKALLSDNSRRFDPDVLRAFIKTLGIYPIGSIVLLSDSRIARVTSVHPDAPLRPGVKILGGKTGTPRPEADETLDLHLEEKIFIVRAVNPKELQSGPSKTS